MTYLVILMQFELILQNKDQIIECMVLQPLFLAFSLALKH